MPKRREHLAPTAEQIGNRLKVYRLHRGRTQEQLAGTLGITFQQVQKYERGTNSIASARVPMLCIELGISPNDLFGWDGVAAEPLPQISTFAYGLAAQVERLPGPWRTAFAQLITAAVGNPPRIGGKRGSKRKVTS